jgi:hypothetical protein
MNIYVNENMYMRNIGFMRSVLWHVFCACTLLVGCFNGNGSSVVFHNLSLDSLDEMTIDGEKVYCVSLVDDSERFTRRLETYLNSDEWASRHVIYNIVDVRQSQNEWWLKWLAPVSLPVTCVFTHDGRLTDLIPGMAKESFLYIRQAAKDERPTVFHYPNNFERDKSKLLPWLGCVLECKKHLDEGICLSEGLELVGDSLKYPYSYYLQIVGALSERDTVVACKAAQSMLTCEDPYKLNLYKNEYITAKKILNPDFDMKDEPSIRVDKDIIELVGCKVDEDFPFSIVVFNDGNRPLCISKIFKSCSCLKWPKESEKVIVPSNDSASLDFIFRADSRGEVMREMYMASNAINNPILYMEIKAFVE